MIEVAAAPEERVTFVCRLAGPMQSWGGANRFSDRMTERVPTYSGLLGLLRCCWGVGRDNDLPDGLQDVELVVRIDAPGQIMTDYHTVNALPHRAYATAGLVISPGALNIMPTGEGKTKDKTLLTKRGYLANATFLLLVSVPAEHAPLMHQALSSPAWSPFLGRKSCPPAWPFYLGYTAGTADALVTELPSPVAKTAATPESLAVHWLNPNRPHGRPGATRRTMPDQPAGPVGSAYHMRDRWACAITHPGHSSAGELMKRLSLQDL